MYEARYLLTTEVCAHAVRAISSAEKEESESRGPETHVQAVEEQVADRLGLLLEDAQVLEDLLVDVDLIRVTDRVLTEEVERDLARRRESHVLVPERAAADRVGLVFSLLVAGTERKAVDQVDGRRALTDRHLFAAQVGRVVGADAVDVFL